MCSCLCMSMSTPNSSGNKQKHGYWGCFHAASARENIYGVWGISDKSARHQTAVTAFGRKNALYLYTDYEFQQQTKCKYIYLYESIGTKKSVQTTKIQQLNFNTMFGISKTNTIPLIWSRIQQNYWNYLYLVIFIVFDVLQSLIIHCVLSDSKDYVFNRVMRLALSRLCFTKFYHAM